MGVIFRKSNTMNNGTNGLSIMMGAVFGAYGNLIDLIHSPTMVEGSKVLVFGALGGFGGWIAKEIATWVKKKITNNA